MLVKFNKNIYNKKAIVQAVSTFDHLANFSVNLSGDNYNVKIEKIDREVKDIIKDEFCNYVIYAMNIS